MSAAPSAIVTGAGSGIGAAIATSLAERRFKLVLTGRRRELLEAVAARIGRPEDVRAVAGDIRETATVERLVSTAMETWGRLDVIVNNAGTARLVPIERVTMDLVRDEMETNTFGHAELILRAWPIFVRQRGGIIVSISSMAAVDPLPGFFGYGASKAALESLARSAAREGEPFGIRAYNITPGAVATPLLNLLFGESTPQAAIPPATIADVVLACIDGTAPDASEGSIRVNG